MTERYIKEMSIIWNGNAKWYAVGCWCDTETNPREVKSLKVVTDGGTTAFCIDYTDGTEQWYENVTASWWIASREVPDVF